MWKRRTDHIDEKSLQRLEDELFRALEATDAEISTAAASPFLYRRVRARIEAEERRKTEERGRWFALLITARHALPALAVIAVLLAVISWTVPFPGLHPSPATDFASIDGGMTYPSREDVMASLVGWQESNAASPNTTGTKGKQ